MSDVTRVHGFNESKCDMAVVHCAMYSCERGLQKALLPLTTHGNEPASGLAHYLHLLKLPCSRVAKRSLWDVGLYRLLSPRLHARLPVLSTRGHGHLLEAA